MLCIVKFQPVANFAFNGGKHPAQDAVSDWIIATDVHDARRQAQAAGEMDLASALYRAEFLPCGKHQLTAQHVALVS